MNKFRFSLPLVVIAIVTMISCSSNFDEPTQNETNESHFVKFTFNVSKTGFDDEIGTRSATQWENGDTIYLLFTSGTDLVYGDAVYNNGEWFVNYNGNLVSNQETTCKAFYYEDIVNSTHSTVYLNENSVMYEDNAGKYTLTDGSLSITATLAPKTGRIRFKGSNHEEIKIYGITHYTSFNRYTGEYTTSKGIIKSKVDGEYTPYNYGFFTDETEPRVNIWKVSEGFTRIFPTTIYKAAESGYVTIPTSNAHNGWQNNVTFKVNNVEFTMIPVEYASGNFLLAQTETTEELYEAIMNDGSSSLLPKNSLTSSEWKDFLNSLSIDMELNFKIPSYNEWLFAFRGGRNNDSFKYSGSNDIDEVAWYSLNSNNNRHNVATKQPNELGFYDMSGNLYEYVTNSYYHSYGGAYNSQANYCTSSSGRDYGTYSGSDIGLRIAISNN